MSQPASTALTDGAPMARTWLDELVRIGDWWAEYAPDQEQGGFFGEIDDNNRPVPEADKGIVLNARILWFFSAAAKTTGRDDYRALAERAYHYLHEYFLDEQFGGYYWALDSQGKVLEDKKQVYAQAFVIYALSAYVELTEDDRALAQARACFDLIETHCLDADWGGYGEACTREWGKIEDLRLSEKDLNLPKSMNTHLHVLEAYTELYRVSGEARVGEALAYGIELFDKYIIDHDSGHMRMFMENDWTDRSPGLTFGHDIECSWLLWKALTALGDDALTQRLKPVVIEIARVCQREALGDYGDVMDSYDYATDSYQTDRVWWVQAEALVGFLTAWRLSGDESFRQSALDCWAFINRYQIDHDKGEWLWHSAMDEPDGARDYKAGFWKGPYHNGRAMIEAARLIR